MTYIEPLDVYAQDLNGKDIICNAAYLTTGVTWGCNIAEQVDNFITDLPQGTPTVEHHSYPPNTSGKGKKISKKQTSGPKRVRIHWIRIPGCQLPMIPM